MGWLRTGPVCTMSFVLCPLLLWNLISAYLESSFSLFGVKSHIFVLSEKTLAATDDGKESHNGKSHHPLRSPKAMWFGFNVFSVTWKVEGGNSISFDMLSCAHLFFFFAILDKWLGSWVSLFKRSILFNKLPLKRTVACLSKVTQDPEPREETRIQLGSPEGFTKLSEAWWSAGKHLRAGRWAYAPELICCAIWCHLSLLHCFLMWKIWKHKMNAEMKFYGLWGVRRNM